MHIPIPSGLQLPQDAAMKPFKLTGTFIMMHGKLMPLELGGVALDDTEEHDKHESAESSDYEEGEDSGEESEECCSECGGKKKGTVGMSKMGGQDEAGKGGNSFVVAIERSMAKR
jgi:hypothetical protein